MIDPRFELPLPHRLPDPPLLEGDEQVRDPENGAGRWLQPAARRCGARPCGRCRCGSRNKGFLDRFST